ncbi:MAG: hypothetical protein EON98_11115 [Chitinophagaceae bacterium]|nr:MAG: hypothetical protein EON98_11115 [Chitinophagaceae bacterium]
MHALFTDDVPGESDAAGIDVYKVSQLAKVNNAAEILVKYNQEADHLRWALKPVFLQYLLKQLDSVIYLDNDIHFFSSFNFLFEELNNHSMLLTPHWSSFDPLPHTSDFELNFKIGLFNAGFVGVNRGAMKALNWWTEVCLFKMSKDTSEGYFVDQRYLDLLPIIDENIGIVRHQGCNVGGWNIHQNKRYSVDGKVLINDKYPVVFVHFNQSTFDQISQGNDPLLKPYLQQYRNSFQSLGFNFDELFSGRIATGQSSIKKLKTSLRLRTRLKQLVFKLYQKL